MSITLREVSFGYEDKRVLERLTLELHEGHRTVIMGSSGRGKTTLLRLLAGLAQPDSGEIAGQPDKVSFMYQDDRLLPWYTVRANLAVTTAATDPQIVDLLSRLGLAGNEDSYPRELSGGMARRVALARALLLPSDMLLLDEPFSGLDSTTKSVVAQVILDECSGKTVVAVLHDEQDAALLGARIVRL